MQEPLDKLEMIYRGMQKQKKIERDRGRDKHSNLYILGLDHEIDMLSVVLAELKAVKENHHSVRDEIMQKIYG